MVMHSHNGAISPRGPEGLTRGGRPGPEELAVRLWRYKQLRTMGYEEREAVRLARDRKIDLHEAQKLVENGCPHRLAALILV
jgi:hypothetical protein